MSEEDDVPEVVYVSDEALANTCERYVASVKAYMERKSGTLRLPPDEALMASVERQLKQPVDVDRFRRGLMNYVGALSIDGKVFKATTLERLHQAFRQALLEQAKIEPNLKLEKR